MRREVPATVRVRASRVANLDTDRLQRRRAYLVENAARLARECDGRLGLRKLARELLSIERELDRRDSAPSQFPD